MLDSFSIHRRLGLPILSLLAVACGSPSRDASVQPGPGESALPPGLDTDPSANPNGGSNSESGEGELPLDPSDDSRGGGGSGRNDSLGPFRSLRVAANNQNVFSAPLAGVAVDAETTALLAIQRSTGSYAIFSSRRGGVSTLYDGAEFLAPADLDRRGDELIVADRAAAGGQGALLAISLSSHEVEEVLARGYRPASVTVDAEGDIYLSGTDPRTREPGVFRVSGEDGEIETIYSGQPLIDPSGIALMADGRVLVADSSLEGSSRGGVFVLNEGKADLFATGFAAGFPAGIALTTDESTLVVSGVGQDGHDRLFVFDLVTGARSVVEAEFTSAQSSSGGLHRKLDSNTFIWSSGTFNGGTVYRLEG